MFLPCRIPWLRHRVHLALASQEVDSWQPFARAAKRELHSPAGVQRMARPAAVSVEVLVRSVAAPEHSAFVGAWMLSSGRHTPGNTAPMHSSRRARSQGHLTVTGTGEWRHSSVVVLDTTSPGNSERLAGQSHSPGFVRKGRWHH